MIAYEKSVKFKLTREDHINSLSFNRARSFHLSECSSLNFLYEMV